MTDCSELKDLYEKAQEKAERLQGEADRTDHEYRDAQDDFYFEGQRECGLHYIIFPQGGGGWDLDGQAECLKEMKRAREHARDDMERDEGRNKQAEAAAADAKGTADAARKLWCLCEAKNRHGGEGGEGGDGGDGGGEPEGGSEGGSGGWSEVAWDSYAAA